MNFEDVKGKKAKDSITGVEGIITGFCQYLHNTDSVLLEYMNGELNLKEEWLPADRVVLL